MRKSILPFLLLSLLSVPAFAAGQMKPGLWEMTMKSDAMQQLPKMPPEQLEQMRKMGVNVPQIRDGAMISKVCVTRQMAESDRLPGMQDGASGCESKNLQRHGNAYSVDIVCNGPDMKGRGKAKGNFTGSESFTSTYDFKGTVDGEPVSQHHESSGKWLGADCGNVRPMSGMLPKK